MAYDSSGDPMKEYSYIGVAYCTGGAHIANTTLRPSTGSHYQYDYQMNEVIKKWTLHNFPNLDSFVIAGASAGSLRVAAWPD